MFDRDVHLQPSDFYRSYSAHKMWAGTAVRRDLDRFSAIMRHLALTQPVHILEVGFGNGEFLDWAREQGHTVEGIEILPEMIEHARSRGHVTHTGPISRLNFKHQAFDLLTAFDVVEHLTLNELVEMLQTAAHLLKPDGRILLQFPNTSSPFSALYQSGDITHKSMVSWPALQQIAATQGWTLQQFFNARVSSQSFLKNLKWWLAHRMRDLIEIILSFAYYGVRLPLDPNVVVILARAEAE